MLDILNNADGNQTWEDFVKEVGEFTSEDGSVSWDVRGRLILIYPSSNPEKQAYILGEKTKLLIAPDEDFLQFTSGLDIIGHVYIVSEIRDIIDTFFTAAKGQE